MTATTQNPEPAASGEVSPAPWHDRLPGGVVVWVFLTAELVTFSMFFVAYAWTYSANPDVFTESQSHLHRLSATINTAVLLTGSWMAARAVWSNHRGRRADLWLWGAAVSGVVFVVLKTVEYAEVLSDGFSMSTNSFWFYYLFVTFMHYLHVAGGVGIMAVVAVKARRGDYGPANALGVEAAAIYWHLIDVIWLFLFPLVYLVG
ncbi:MAG TPA: cytochrome c oxidase subunit 3 family protein [Acidimicrobiales bacterium]|nr:cytochrome c oxidase subunit 3 family protein [Acidimicrobiales bacterium]